MSHDSIYSNELTSAIEWFRKFLVDEDPKRGHRLVPSLDQANTLCASLKTQLQERLEGHWFPSEPRRGQAHRSLSLFRHARPDPLILRAFNEAGLQDPYACLGREVREFVLFVDPGEVVARFLYRVTRHPLDMTVYRGTYPQVQAGQLSATSRTFQPSPPLSPRAGTCSNTPPSVNMTYGYSHFGSSENYFLDSSSGYLGYSMPPRWLGQLAHAQLPVLV